MEFDKRLKIRANKAPLSFGHDKIELYGYEEDEHHVASANVLILEGRKIHEELKPFCTIEFGQAQVLMDDLWSAGIRPTEGSGSAGALKAVQNHLADMKKILFHKLGIKE